MRTIETTVTITPNEPLTVQIPGDIVPGKHRIILVIDEQLVTASEDVFEQPLVADDPIFGLGTDPIDCGLVDAAENHDRYLYTEL